MSRSRYNDRTTKIQFPDTQILSADVNTLDDYEEGTFTPIAIFAAGSGTITYSTQAGRYTKIGNIVFFSIDLNTLSIALRTGNMTIGGLPFTSSSVVPESSIYVGLALNLAIIAGQSLTGIVVINSTTIDIRVWNAVSGASILQHTGWTDNGRIFLSGHYYV